MTKHIERAHWGTFFDDLAKKHHGFEARLEIIITSGDKTETLVSLRRQPQLTA